MPARDRAGSEEVRCMILLGYLALGAMCAFVLVLVVGTSERRR